VSNIPLCLFDPLGLASKLYLIIGPNTGNTTDNFYADPAVPLDNLDATIQSAKDEYKRASGEKCDVEVVIYASSRSSPMGLGELSTYLSSSGLTGDADAIALIFHGETVGGETGLIVYDHYSDRASGWVRGKAYKLSDVISDTSGVAAEVDKLFISCCFNRQLPPNAGGKKIVILGTGGAQGRLEVGVVLTAIGSLVKDLCCRDTTLSGSGDSGGQGENQCCPLK
jgi:hypothetical protein